MPQLKRSESVFLMPLGEKRSLCVVDTIPNTTPSEHLPPPQVILTYGDVKKAYGRKRLMTYDYKDVIALFCRDFQLPRRPKTRNALQVTFYRTHGKDGYDNSLVSIDQESWLELMKNVTHIDLKKHPNHLVRALISGGCLALLFWFYLWLFA